MPDDKDQKLNPGQTHSDELFNRLDKAESGGTIGGKGKSSGSQNGPGIDGVRNAEESPGGNWKNNVQGLAQSMAKPGGFIGFVKKKSPILAIILTLVGGGIGITSFMGPTTILFQFVSTEVGRFNTQLGSMDSRSISMYADKTTSGISCGVIINILCKYSTMSAKQVSNFENAGITVEAEGTTIFGRIKPKSFIFDDVANSQSTLIPANEFKSALKNNPDFAQAVDKAYNPKFAGFSDNIFVKWVEAKLGITKAPENLAGDTPEEQLTSLKKDINIPADDSYTPPELGSQKPDGSGPYTQADIDRLLSEVGDITSGTAAIAASGESTSIAAMKAAINANAEVIGGALSITGAAHLACTVYGTVQAVGYAAKTVRSAQLDKFGFALLNVESQARAGVVKEKDMTFMGNLLTTATKDENGNMTSATDSFGYRYASGGMSNAGTMPTSSTRFMAGGGLAGVLVNLHSILNQVLLGTPKTVCGFVTNPFVITGSLIAGLALIWAAPTFSVGKMVKDALPMLTLYVGLQMLPAILKDVIAGVLIDKTTTGAAAGDALTSGISGLMSKSAAAGGNAPLTPTQAVAYQNMSNDIAEKYAAKDRMAYSPLDPTNKNTFMGKIVNQLMPYVSKMSSVAGMLSSVTSITSRSLSSIFTPSTKAASTDDFTQCQDEDYKALGIATDPFCNVIYGIPPDSLGTNPIQVTKTLLDSGQIDETTGDPAAGSDYESFVKECINRADPLGAPGKPGEGSKTDGSTCLFSANNQNYYLHHIDQRVQANMDDEQVATGSSGGGTDTVPSGTLKSCTENYDKYTSQSDLKRIYGSSASAVSSNLVSVDVLFESGAKSVKVAKQAAPCFKAVQDALVSTGVTHRPKVFDGTFNWRPNRNNASSLSFHSFGIAIDLDAGKNPNGGGSPGHCTTNMPADYVAVWKKYGFRWGGDYRSTCDAMHLEWLGGS